MYLGLFIDRNETNWARLHNGGNISKTSFCRLSTLSLTMTDALGAIHKSKINPKISSTLPTLPWVWVISIYEKKYLSTLPILPIIKRSKISSKIRPIRLSTSLRHSKEPDKSRCISYSLKRYIPNWKAVFSQNQNLLQYSPFLLITTKVFV